LAEQAQSGEAMRGQGGIVDFPL